MKNKAIGLVTSVLLVVCLLVGLVACAKAPSATGEKKVVKVGVNLAQNWPIGLDCIHMLEIEADKINNNGGLDIGGEKYLIDFIFDDSKMDMALVKTAAEKEIFQDGCKFIFGDDFAAPLYRICEDNKVAGILVIRDFELFSPQYNWVWCAGSGTATYPGTIIFAARKFPDLKTFQGVYPDRFDGHSAAEVNMHFAKAAGLTALDDIFYPPTATDLSAVGTKIKNLNPGFLVPYQGGPQFDAAVMKAAYSAGWRGQIVGAATMPAETLMGIAGADAVEGLVGLAWPAEFDPATTEEGKEFKAAYIAKYGKWDNPEVVQSLCWFVLKAALQRADSPDPNDVKAVLDNGKEFKCPLGTGQQFPRLDQDNPRTVDCVIGNLPMKQIVGGQIKHLATISVDDQIEYSKLVYGKPW